MSARWYCDMRCCGFGRGDHVTVLGEEAGGVGVGCEDDGVCLDYSTLGDDIISFAIIVRFDFVDGGVGLKVYVSFAQNSLEKLRYEFVGPQ